MSTRRRARAGEGRTLEVDGKLVTPPPELLDPNHPRWREPIKDGPAGDRLGGRTHPHNRRNHAAARWAVAHGVFLSTYSNQHADWGQLRRAGLIS